MLASCLVTSSPTFEDPPDTKPFLDFETATPDPRKVLVIESGVSSVEFRAFVRSEDRGRPVQGRLLLDYGFPSATGLPFRSSQNVKQLDASSFDNTSRVFSIKADLESVFNVTGCHRITLMASHAFDDGTGCPVDPDDFTQITWTVIGCASEEGCPTIDFADPDACPPVSVSCASLAGAGGGP